MGVIKPNKFNLYKWMKGFRKDEYDQPRRSNEALNWIKVIVNLNHEGNEPVALLDYFDCPTLPIVGVA